MKRITLAIATLLMCHNIVNAQVPKTSKSSFAFQNTKLADDKRIDLLLAELTLDEKIGLLSSNLGVERLGIPACGHYEGLHGLTLGGAGKWNKKTLADGTRVADPRPTTVFPQAYGLGETWDKEILHRVGEVTAEEARWYMQSPLSPQHSLVMRAPNADLARDPRWGRTEESFGEDAYLVGTLSASMIQGLQGDDEKYWKTASLMKHFLANSNEDGRDSTSSNFDNRLFREYFSRSFYKGIKEGGSQCFMDSYNAWNGTPMMIHACLDSIARRQWDVKGILCTDGGALDLLINAHHAFHTFAEGAAATIKSTTGQFLGKYKEHVQEALAKGYVSEADIDRAIRGNLYVALKLGLLDGKKSRNPYLNIGMDTTAVKPWDKQDIHDYVRKVTAKSVVLLKNEGILPLHPGKLKKIAVVGQWANQGVEDWYGGTSPYEVTILQGIRNAVSEDVEVLFAPNNQMGEAERIAAGADVVLVCVGNHPYGTDERWKINPVTSDGREAVDRKSLQLPDEDLVRQMKKVNPNTVLVLVCSFPYTINWSQENLPAILHITHCSQEQGNGLADVLFGKVSPAGRTTQTWVKDICDLPDIMDYDIRHGRTYMYNEKPVLYPFGYGLSYTKFQYNPNVQLMQDNWNIIIKVNVTNVGDMDGDEVVQLYASYPNSKMERPKKQLCAFERISLKKGETKLVTLKVDKEDISYWDETLHRFTTEKELTDFLIGASSEDIRRKISIEIK